MDLTKQDPMICAIRNLFHNKDTQTKSKGMF